jgi:hypothetical protein
MKSVDIDLFGEVSNDPDTIMREFSPDMLKAITWEQVKEAILALL